MKIHTITEICCSLLILLFVYTGVSKLTNISFFQTQLSLYPYINSFAKPISIAVPLLELVIAFLLIYPRSFIRNLGLKLSFLLLTIFTLYLIIMINTNVHLPCSCGGVITKMTWKQHIVFNLFFIAVSIIGIISLTRQPISHFESGLEPK